MCKKTLILGLVCVALLVALSSVARAPNSPDLDRTDIMEPVFGGASHSAFSPNSHYYQAPYQPRNGEKSILSRVRENPAAFSTFLALVHNAGLERFLQSKGPYTLFLPTNEAFAKMSQEQLQALLSNRDECREFVLAHIVLGRVASDELEGAGSMTTAQGLTVTALDDCGDIWVQNAWVIQSDVQAGNGIIHVVGTVLTPGMQVVLN